MSLSAVALQSPLTTAMRPMSNLGILMVKQGWCGKKRSKRDLDPTEHL